MGYRQALRRLLDNDDTAWIHNGDPISVTASFVADNYHKADDKVRADLVKMDAKGREI